MPVMPDNSAPAGQDYQLAAQGTNPAMAKQQAIAANVAQQQARAQQLHDSAAKMSSMAKAKSYLQKTMGGPKPQESDPVPGIQSE